MTKPSQTVDTGGLVGRLELVTMCQERLGARVPACERKRRGVGVGLWWSWSEREWYEMWREGD